MGQSQLTSYTHIMQAFITLALVASASAAPQLLAAHGVAHPVAHAIAHPVVHAHPVAHAVAHPVVHAVATPDLAEPSPYTYSYAVADDLSQANFQQTESNDGTGAVTGSYSVNLPDGRIQTVTYNANDITGNVATVEYTGEAVYPPAPAGGYVSAAPRRYCPPCCPPCPRCCPRCPRRPRCPRCPCRRPRHPRSHHWISQEEI